MTDNDKQGSYIADLRARVTPHIVGKNVVSIRVSGARHILSRIDVLEAEIERLREALNKGLNFLTDPQIGTLRYMEGEGFYRDLEDWVAVARKALSKQESI